MEYCGAGSVSDIMRILDRTVGGMSRIVSVLYILIV